MTYSKKQALVVNRRTHILLWLYQISTDLLNNDYIIRERECYAMFGLLVLLTSLLLPLSTGVQPSNILLASMPSYSHLVLLTHFSDLLVKRGHVLHAALPEHVTELHEVVRNAGMKPLLYKLSDEFKQKWDVQSHLKSLLQSKQDGDSNEEFKHRQVISLRFTDLCDHVLSDRDFRERASKLNFKFAIVDSFALTRCMHALPYLLGIPHAGVPTAVDPWVTKLSWNPAVLPSWILAMNEDMSFYDRLKNVIVTTGLSAFPLAGNAETTVLRKHFSANEISSWSHLASKASIFFIPSDHLSQYATPAMPHVIYTDAGSAKPAKPLPRDIMDFISKHKNGVIFISFGSVTESIPNIFVKKLFEALTMIKEYGILLKYPKDIGEKVSANNILMQEWLPQNDILAHPKSRLFVSHCGLRSYQEALYHGVPMVGLPLFGDQDYWAVVMSSRGQGIKLESYSFTPGELHSAITEVISNPKYKNKAMLQSALIKDKPMNASEVVAHHVEQIIKYGDGHLRPSYAEMPWYQFLMLDIFAAILAAVSAIIILVVYFCKCLCRKYCGPGRVLQKMGKTD